MPLITIRSLPNIGRTGNQLFLYCFAKGYAEKMKCDLQVPDWWGRKVFSNANEPMVTKQLPQTELDSDPGRPLGYFFGQTDIDLRVFAQHQKYLDYYTRTQAKEWLKVNSEWEELNAIRGFKYSAMHKRRGDYVTYEFRNYCIVSDKSYEKAVADFHIPNPLFEVSEEESVYHPELDTTGLGWLRDFLTLRDAAHLLRANSSFSWWAATLGNGKVYSPVVNEKSGWQDVEFVEGNHPVTAGKFRNQSDLHLKD